MLGFTRRLPDRPKAARFKPARSLETLEGRQLLTAAAIKPYSPYVLQPRYVNHTSPPIAINHGTSTDPFVLNRLDNEGKILTGKDRAGDEWQITVHGPGVAIVTDATPNDGALDDDIATIQLVGTDINKTYVTGSVSASARVVTNGQVAFNQLIATSGVKSIILNGFNLAETVSPPAGQVPNSNTFIALLGGVRYLSFNNIFAPVDLAQNAGPINVQIGRADTPLPLQVTPTIKIGSVFNTAFDSSVTTNQNTLPETTPTVQFLINGRVGGLEMISATGAPESGSNALNFPIVGTTGRTAIRATSIGRLKVIGTARNLTASRTAVPFENSLSGLNGIGSADFGGNADAVGLDVRGNVGRLRFARGLGSPVGAGVAATTYGTPDALVGYPSKGLLGGLVAARRIGKVSAGPANVILQTGQDPDLMQVRRTGSTKFFKRPGNALTSAAIVSAGDIDSVHLVGDAQTSEIKAGQDYPLYSSGVNAVRGRAAIRRYAQRGNLVSSVVSADVAPVDGIYGNYDANGHLLDKVGPGSIRGYLTGGLYSTNSQTALGNRGVGFYARVKQGYLPPPVRRIRSAQGIITNP